MQHHLPGTIREQFMSSIGQNGHFFRKKAPKTLQTPYSVPFLIVLHQNKALYNFYKRGKCPIAGHIKGLDQGQYMMCGRKVRWKKIKLMINYCSSPENSIVRP